MAVKASASITLTRVDDGLDAAVQSDTAPEDTSYLWCDTSVEPPLLKQWDGTEWVIVGDSTEQIESLRESIVNTIDVTRGSIIMEVGQQYYSKDETETLISDINTKFTQTKDSFEMQFTSITGDIASLNEGTNANFEEIKQYIRFEDGNIILGKTGNEITLRIENDRITFLQAGKEVAYFSESKLYVTDGQFINSLQIGNFAYIPRANGSLDFKKVR